MVSPDRQLVGLTGELVFQKRKMSIESEVNGEEAKRAVALIAEVSCTARRHATPCGEGELVWRCWGEGRPLVLLHGGTGSWTHWIRNVQALAQTRTVWVPDMPGYGDSASPPKGSGVAEIAAILAGGISCLLPAGRDFDLVGFSFGGLVAGHLAAHVVEDLGTLVLVGAGGLGLREGRKLPLVAWRHLKSEADRRAAHRHNLSGLMLWDQTSVDALALEVQARNAERSRINSGPFSRGDTLLEPLSRIAGQVRLRGIWGRHDVTAGGRLAGVEPILRRTDPHAALTVIEDAGHWVIYEKPEQFHAALGEAL